MLKSNTATSVLLHFMGDMHISFTFFHIIFQITKFGPFYSVALNTQNIYCMDSPRFQSSVVHG